MGVSTNAILAYGIDFGDDDDLDFDGLFESHGVDTRDPEFDRDWEDLYAIAIGSCAEENETYGQYRERVEAAGKRSKCEIVVHCSRDTPMYLACASASKHIALRGYPTEVQGLQVDPQWDAVLMDYCAAMKLPYSQPKWLLCSMWD